MSGEGAEGIIRFRLEHETRALDEDALGAAARTLSAWREILRGLGLVGQDPERYGGLAFGNLSVRLEARGTPGRRSFLVTGSQAGGPGRLDLAHFARVERWDLEGNQIVSAGPVPPSSESLTHAAIYDVLDDARAVFHAHAPAIWTRAVELGVPFTRPEAACGTAEMALEVQSLAMDATLGAGRLFAMGGHEDGVLAFGASPDEAGERLVRQLARALA